MKRKKVMTPEDHQEKIMRDTLKMSDAMVAMMGGPTKEEAREYFARKARGIILG